MSKKSKGTGTLRQRKNGSWEGMYYLNGKRNSIYGKTQDEVRIRLNKICAATLEGTYIEPAQDKLEGWLLEWLETYSKPTIRHSTYISYEGYIKNHINPKIGHYKLKLLKTDILQKFFNEKGKNGRLDNKEGGLSAKTLRNMRNMLNVALNQAVDNELITRNLLAGIKLPKLKNKEMRFLTIVEQNKLSDAVLASNEILALGIIITLDSGIRLGELLGLQWSRVNFDDNSFFVTKSLGRRKRPNGTLSDAEIIDTVASPNCKTVMILGDAKTETGKRVTYMTDRVKKAMLRLKELNDTNRNQLGKSFNKYDFVLCTELGNPVDPRTYEDIFKRHIKKAKINDANFHSLRHTFATRILENGCDLKTLSNLLGHAQASTSLNMYAHSMDATKRSAIGLLNVV
jgi:integrase